jgi:hypothetical protein
MIIILNILSTEYNYNKCILLAAFKSASEKKPSKRIGFQLISAYFDRFVVPLLIKMLELIKVNII